MASNWKFYPQSALVHAATLDEDVGTSSTLENVLNTRKNSRLDVDTVTGSAFRFQIDLGSGNTLTPDFFAIVNNNIYSAAAGIVGVMHSSSDTLSGTSPGGTPLYTFPIAAGAADEEGILVRTNVAGSYTKRYFWVEVTSTDATLYMGQVLLGTKVEPSIDPNWDAPIEIDIESGRIVNTTPGGVNWKTRTHGKRNGWLVNYELITSADLAIIEALWDDSAVDIPFVFTNDGGTTYYYAELVGNPQVTPVQAGLYNVTFTIGEVIA